MTIGPVQMLVLGFSEPEFTGKIAAKWTNFASTSSSGSWTPWS